jgi:hypothetical protein
MGAQSIDLPAPAANRMLHIDWPTPSAKDWAEGIMHGFQPPRLDSLPLGWRRSKAVREARKDVAGFLAHMTTDLLEVPEGSEEMGLAWPSPRSWELAADALGAARFLKSSRGIELKVVAGCVSLMVASRFFEWVDDTSQWSETNRPVLDKLLEGSKDLKEIPGFDKIDRLYTIGRQLVARVVKEPSLKNWNRAWGFIDRTTQLFDDVQSGKATGVGLEFKVAPLAVMASDLLDLLNDPEYAKSPLKKAGLPDESLLEKLSYENIRVPRGSR